MNKEVFKKHRKNILNQMEDNTVLMVVSRQMGGTTVEDKCNVNRNYYYVSGVIEFQNIVLLYKNKEQEKEMIFINPYDEYRAKWFGAPKPKEEVLELSGIEDIRYLSTFESVLASYLNECKGIYLDIDRQGLDEDDNASVSYSKKIASKYPFVQILDDQKLFRNARMVKEEEEIEEMKKAISITRKGIEAILSNIGEMYEYQLESYFDQAIKYHGATGYAFTTIAASGVNGTCLHYSKNDSLAKNGDLILFDLGASCNMYCADISRTFPISGKFSERQKLFYNIVLGAQKKVLATARPGLTTRDLNNVVIEYYAEELKKIGLIKDASEVSKYYYHGVSHHIGLEVHDLSVIEPLKAGEIISNEPGLYIKEEGIGIRIEDDILITENGAICLSQEILKEVDDIEKFIEEHRK